MDKFDKVFCWTITVGVVGAACWFLLTTDSWRQGLLVGLLSTACVYTTWTHVATQTRKISEQHERDEFLAAAVRYFRIADESEIGLTGVDSYERMRALMAWARYRTQVLDRPHNRSHNRSPR